MTTTRAWLGLPAAAMLLLTGCEFFHQWHPQDADAYHVVFEAAERGDVPAVTAALDREPRLIRLREQDRLTLLHEAAGEGQTAMAAMLLARGADADARTGGGLTALHLAAQNGDVAMMDVLVGHGAKVNATDHRGMTPLDQALSHDHADAAAFLRSHGGRPGRGH